MPGFEEDRFIKIKTPPLGEEEVVVERLRGEERISSPFHFEVELHTTDQELDFSKLMGKAVTISYWDRDGGKLYRNVHGIVTRFVQAGLARDIAIYRADIRPTIWTLGLGSDSRIFQEKTAPEIIEQVFKDQGVIDYEVKLGGTFDKRDYCVQYNETDLDFVSRLMEEEGIFYYFRHEESKHVLVLGDGPSAFETMGGRGCLDYGVYDVGDSTDSIIRCTFEENLVTEKVVLRDYNFEIPETPLSVNEKTILKQKLDNSPEVYFYPGRFSKTAGGKVRARVRIERLEGPNKILSGDSLSPHLTVGAKFELKEHFRRDLDGTKYAVIGLSHDFSDDSYENHFEAIPATVVYRPLVTTPRPVIPGTQTAKVVGAKNSELFTDKYGRVKLQFHWDREGKFDDKTSCWVRVAQSLAGAKWGQVWLPRIGQEVVVSFEEGDPDRPLVTGAVYNADNMPPYTLPDHIEKSGIKTQSLLEGKAKNFNELYFYDKLGKEEIYFHAERDFNREVENNDTLKVGFEHKDKGDQTIDIYNDRTVTLDKGNDTLEIKTGDRTVTLAKGDYSTTVKQGNYSTTVKQGNVKIKVNAGKVDIQAAKEILLKVGGSSIKLDMQGVTIAGTKVSAAAKMKAELKGVMVDVAADAMLKLKGGILKIN